ncbi:MAG: right-handed parallel beta-helix repeat-containing protein [Candidatus Bathyarchaeum sp.]|nr:MAG: right-handed parallel beta-helix repeat-containing protein [Candidatus Bathyarchaeum sp.]
MKKLTSMIVILLVLSSVLTISGLNIVRVEAATISVPDDYSTIQAAIDAASDDDTVLVKAGEYNEVLEIEKPLSLVGEDIDTTTIHGSITITQDQVNISGLTLRKSDSGNVMTAAAIYLYHSDYCDISGNILVGFTQGVSFSDSSYNTIEGNIIENCYIGFLMIYSNNNTIRENDITYGYQDILLSDSHHNKFIGNNITDAYSGIALRFSNYNTFYHNNFINNTDHVSDSHYTEGDSGIWVSVNFWDNEVVGNYWSNYTGVDSDADGIGETPYVMDEYNQDNFPLVHPHNFASEPPETDSPPPQTDEPFPIIWIIVAIIIIAAFGVTTLLYFTKLRKTPEPHGEITNLHC